MEEGSRRTDLCLKYFDRVGIYATKYLFSSTQVRIKFGSSAKSQEQGLFQEFLETSRAFGDKVRKTIKRRICTVVGLFDYEIHPE